MVDMFYFIVKTINYQSLPYALKLMQLLDLRMAELVGAAREQHKLEEIMDDFCVKPNIRSVNSPINEQYTVRFARKVVESTEKS